VDPVSGWNSGNKRFWTRHRRSVRTSRQLAQEAVDRLAKVKEDLTGDPHDDTARDVPYLRQTIESASDPQVQQQDQARRTHAGQRERRMGRLRARNQRDR
jgi:hypothetical protein